MAGAEARSSPNPRSDWRLNVDDSPKKTIGFNKKRLSQKGQPFFT
jgi:hypothetical protein